MKEFINTRSKESKEGGIKADLGGYEDRKDVIYSVYDKEKNDDTTAIARVSAPANLMEEITNKSFISVVTDEQVIDDYRVPFGNGIVGLESIDVPDIEIDNVLNSFKPDDILDAEEMDKAYIIQNWTTGILDENDRSEILLNYNSSNLQELLYKIDEGVLESIVQEYGINSFPKYVDTSIIARSVIQNNTRGVQVLQDQEITAMNKVAKVKNRRRSYELSKNSRENMVGEMGKKCKCILDGKNYEHKEMLQYCMGKKDEPPWIEDGERPPALGNPSK